MTGSKAEGQSLIANLQQTFRSNLKKLQWMDPDTLRNAEQKLDLITNKVGYPDKWPSYDSIHVQPGKYFESTMALRYSYTIAWLSFLKTHHHRLMSQFNMDSARAVYKSLAEVGKPVDKSKWFMDPHEVNAYYSPDTNEIVFPAGILQPPFFNQSYLHAMNYGGKHPCNPNDRTDANAVRVYRNWHGYWP